MKICLAIPTYWTHPRGRGPVEVIHDHPTPLDDPGTLGRTLQSLTPLMADAITVVVAAAAAHPSLAAAVAARVEALIAALDLPYPVAVCSHPHLERLRDFCQAQGRGTECDLLSLSGYSQIRNLTLVLGTLLEADLLVSLDDDEVIRDTDFFARISRDVQHLSREHPCFGLAGLYETAAGEVLLPEPNEPWSGDWPKLAWMNEAFSRLLHADVPLPETVLALGGNMILPASLYRRIPFDPAITRGEDIDYVLNARLYGIPFFLDAALRVVHLPPDQPHPVWLRLRQDVIRFAYSRRKLAALASHPELTPVRAEDLDPYPGRFLADDLERRALRSHTRLALDYLSRDEAADARATLENLAVFLNPPPPGDPLAAYLEAAHRWQALQGWLGAPETAAAARRAVWGTP